MYATRTRRFAQKLPLNTPLSRWSNRYYPRSANPYFNGLGDDIRVSPTPDQIKAVPTQGYFYRIKAGQTWWKVAKMAYGPPPALKPGLLTMNRSTWNDHIDRRRRGWESYNVDGLQSTPDYSASAPHAAKGSGHDYPTAWIPPVSGEEPEEIFPPIDGGGQIGPPGPMGPMGPSGPIGPGGARGVIGPGGPIGPPGEATDEAIRDAVQIWLTQNPPPGGQDGDVGPAGPAGPIGPPGEATEAAIMAAVRQYLITNPPPSGPRGDLGPVGPLGPDGPMGPIGPVGPAGTTGSGGGGGGNNMWVLPMLAVFVLAATGKR